MVVLKRGLDMTSDKARLLDLIGGEAVQQNGVLVDGMREREREEEKKKRRKEKKKAKTLRGHTGVRTAAIERLKYEENVQ